MRNNFFEKMMNKHQTYYSQASLCLSCIRADLKSLKSNNITIVLVQILQNHSSTFSVIAFDPQNSVWLLAKLQKNSVIPRFKQYIYIIYKK